MDQSIDQLVKPVKELAKSWNIDISLILQQYQQEILETQQGDDIQLESFENSTKFLEELDFSRAAVIVQSSALVYQKKVQYLLQLVKDIIIKQNQQKNRKRKRKNGENQDDDGNDNDEEENYDQFLNAEEELEQPKNNQQQQQQQQNSNQNLPQLQQRKILPAIFQQLDNVDVDDDRKNRDDYLKYVRNVCYYVSNGVLLLDPEMANFFEDFRQNQQYNQQQYFYTPDRSNNNNNNFNQFQNVPFGSPAVGIPDQLTPQNPNLENLNMHAYDDSGDDGGIGAPDDDACMDINNNMDINFNENNNNDENFQINENIDNSHFSQNLRRNPERNQQNQQQNSDNDDEQIQNINYFEMHDAYDAGNQVKKPVNKNVTYRKPGSLKPIKLQPEIIGKIPIKKNTKNIKGVVCPWFKDAWIQLQNNKKNSQNNQPRNSRQQQLRQQQELLEQNLFNQDGHGNFYDESDGEDGFNNDADSYDGNNFENNNFQNENNNFQNGENNFQNDENFAPFNNDFTANFEFEIGDDDRIQEWANLCRQYVEQMMNKAADMQQQTQSTRKIDSWKKLFENQMLKNSKKPLFDIKQQQTQLVEEIKGLGMTQTQGEQTLEVPLQIQSVLYSYQKYQVSRKFLSLLQCYNDSNIEIMENENDENQMQIDELDFNGNLSQKENISFSQIILISDLAQRSILREQQVLNPINESEGNIVENSQLFSEGKNISGVSGKRSKKSSKKGGSNRSRSNISR